MTWGVKSAGRTAGRPPTERKATAVCGPGPSPSISVCIVNSPAFVRSGIATDKPSEDLVDLIIIIIISSDYYNNNKS